MGRAPGYDKKGLKKGPWTPEEDQKLIDYINRHGHQSWSSIPESAGLPRCSKSCRLRWVNYLRPDIKRGDFSLEEQQTIIQLHSEMGNKWSAIAARLPGRTDNEIKNYWHTQLKKRLIQMGIDPVTHGPMMHPANVDQLFGSGALRHVTAVLQEAVTREYLRIVAEAMMLQQTDGYTQVELVGEINSTKPPTRSLPQNSLPKPDFIPTPLMSQICTPAPENRLGSPQYNTLVFHAPEQIQSRPQTIQKMQYLSPESNLHSLDTEQVGQDNYTASHSAPIITNRANMISDEKFKGNETHSNILNACSLPCQQHSESHGFNSSVALATSEVWPHENLFHFSKSDSEPLPTLVSPTSSQTILNDSCLVTDNSSPVGNTKLSNTADTSTGTSNDSYLSPPAFLFDFPESSKKNDNVSDMQSFENGRDYWTNMLKYVPESSLDSNLDMQSSDY